MILQDITVIAIDQSDNTESSSPPLGRMVTVVVDTAQAQELALARQVGKLSLTLRGIGEANEEALAPVTEESLSDFERVEEAPKPVVRVRRAGRVSDENIDEVAEPAEEAATGN